MPRECVSVAINSCSVIHFSCSIIVIVIIIIIGMAKCYRQFYFLNFTSSLVSGSRARKDIIL